MELVAASKMRRAQDVALAGRRYNQTMEVMLHNLLPQVEAELHPLLRPMAEDDDRPILAIVIGPDKGLCGGLISNLLREIHRLHKQHPMMEYATMGKRVRDGVRKLGGTIVADVPLLERPRLRDVVGLSQVAINDFKSGKYGQVLIINTQYVSTLVQKPQIRPLLPLTLEAMPAGEMSQTEFLYEPGLDMVLEALLPRYVEMAIYQALLEAQASEHSARMIAMKNAGDNASELQQELTLAYNQLRQATITAELAEIAAAA
jgi:F-type H+-transporting ATPase subunit gamma